MSSCLKSVQISILIFNLKIWCTLTVMVLPCLHLLWSEPDNEPNNEMVGKSLILGSKIHFQHEMFITITFSGSTSRLPTKGHWSSVWESLIRTGKFVAVKFESLNLSQQNFIRKFKWQSFCLFRPFLCNFKNTQASQNLDMLKI